MPLGLSDQSGFKKNSPIFWIKRKKDRAVLRLSKLVRRLFPGKLIFRKEFRNASPKIFHACYHRCGTVWFSNILRQLAVKTGLKFCDGEEAKQASDSDIILYPHSRVDVNQLGHYRGSHMVRDPRDMMISGYFYHLWTKEKWCHKSKERFGGKSYQQVLNALSPEEGLALTIRESSDFVEDMMKWDYQNPLIMEIRYEDLIEREAELFPKIFSHYGFKPAAIEIGCEAAEKYTLRNVAIWEIGNPKGKSHFRSGEVAQWREIFQPSHKALFKQLYPDILVKLGYEKDNEW